MRKSTAVCVYVNTLGALALSLFFFILPVFLVLWDLSDPALHGAGVPRCAFRWHRGLSPRYEKWARARVAAGRASQLGTGDISGTEWPLFGSVFYLWATESLEQAAQEDPSLCRVPPSQYARGAIEAAAALVADPNHAGWVRQHWGDEYLQKENLFYRMLLISALTSYQKLLGDARYEPLLRGQVESLAGELDESPHGLLDDYPGQCYPVDILPAIAAIRRADVVLGTDHSEFAARAIRGFQDGRLDRATGLPAYVVDSKTGRAEDCARGVGLSYMLIWAAELWPQTAESWYGQYEKQFWQEGSWFAGFREYPRDVDVGWFNMADVDAGPVIGGYGVGASAFGVGAARVMGRSDQAYELATETLAICWPLPGGRLLTPRILSNVSDAPYLGEAAVLFALTRRTLAPVQGDPRATLPAIVYIPLAGLLLIGAAEIAVSLRRLRRWRRGDPRWCVPLPQCQTLIWAILLVCAPVVWLSFGAVIGLVVLLAAMTFPLQRKRPPAAAPTDDGASDSTS